MRYQIEGLKNGKWSWRTVSGGLPEEWTLHDNRHFAEWACDEWNKHLAQQDPNHDPTTIRVVERPDLQPPPPPTTTAKARNEGREHWARRGRHRHPYRYD